MKGFDVDPIAIWASDAPEASISSKESDTPKNKYYFSIGYLLLFRENDLLSSESVVSSSSVMVTSRSTWSWCSKSQPTMLNKKSVHIRKTREMENSISRKIWKKTPNAGIFIFLFTFLDLDWGFQVHLKPSQLLPQPFLEIPFPSKSEHFRLEGEMMKFF